MNQFIPSLQPFKPDLSDADILYYKNFISSKRAIHYMHKFEESIFWQQHSIKIFGKNFLQPRLTALFAEKEIPYSYSGLTLSPNEFLPELLELRKELEKFTPNHFTHCLANLYRNGQDSMGLHSDNEKELGENPVIASISLGAIRRFKLKHKFLKEQKFEIELEPGSLLIMQGKTQHFWKHALPKTKRETGPRINLTFRKIIEMG